MLLVHIKRLICIYIVFKVHSGNCRRTEESCTGAPCSHVFTGTDRMHVKWTRIAALFFLSAVRNGKQETVGNRKGGKK